MLLNAELLLKEFGLTSNKEIVKELIDLVDKMVQFEEGYSGLYIIFSSKMPLPIRIMVLPSSIATI